MDQTIELLIDFAGPNGAGHGCCASLADAHQLAYDVEANTATIKRVISRIDMPVGAVRSWDLGPHGEHWSIVDVEVIGRPDVWLWNAA